jgi:hypothetical protein
MATVELRGPFFDSRNKEIRSDMELEVLRRVGGQALADVHQILNVVIRHPTPYYETQIELKVKAPEAIVDDNKVIYGPWLEGVGSRNSPKTRFPGYHSFRRATQQVEREVPNIVRPIVDRAVGRLNE